MNKITFIYLILTIIVCCFIQNTYANGTVEIANAKESLTQIESHDKIAESPYVVNKGDFVAAPIPFSNPTIGSGLAGVLAYFYPQDDEQKKSQPPSVTGLGGFYSNNHSWGAAAGHASYWDDNNWQATGGLGYMDLKLPFVSKNTENINVDVEWDIQTVAALAEIHRRFWGQWYIGFNAEYIAFDQQFNVDINSSHFTLSNDGKSVGVGLSFLYDSRDMPTNPYEGIYFKLGATLFDKHLDNTEEFESYSLNLKGYTTPAEALTITWKVNGCAKQNNVPLWAACRIGLRGFSATEYMALESVETEGEVRWRFAQRWGLATFIGAGMQFDASHVRENELIVSYGFGFRYTIQPAERINIRLDYARSNLGDDALYFSVGEAF